MSGALGVERRSATEGGQGAARPRRTVGWPAAAAACAALTLAGCSGSSSGGSSGGSSDKNIAGTAAADTWNSASVGSGGKVTWTIEKTMDNWNLLSADGDTFDYGQVINALAPSAFTFNPSYDVTLNTDLLSSADETSTSPETIVYQIKPNAVWSDGTAINADDFVYNWQIQNGSDANIPAASTTGYQDVKSVTGSNGGKTVTVVFATPFSDWKSLFGTMYPAHIAQQHGNNEQSFSWFQSNPLPVSGGPFVASSVSSDHTSVILSRNPKYYGTPAKLDQIVFRAITDASQEPTALQNKEVDGIYPQPELNLVTQVKNMGGQVTWKIDSGLSFEHVDFNLKNPALGNTAWGKTLRTAMFTAVNRQDIIAKTIKQFDSSATVLNSRMLVPGQSGYQDNVTQFGLGSGDVDKARQELTAAGFKNAVSGGRLTAPDGSAVPAFSMKYTVGNQIRQNTCDLFAAEMAQLGITVNVSPTDNLGATLAQTGNGYSYDIIDFAWVDTPFPTSANQPLYTTNGGSNYGGYSNAQVDTWLNGAAGTTDSSTQITDLNDADQQISKDAYTLPLYQKPTFLAFYPNVGNVRDNTTSVGPTYNIGQWGLKSSSS